MSPSWAGSKRSSAGSSRPATQHVAIATVEGEGFVARFERAVAPFAHRFSEAPAVMALREALPAAFGVMLAVIALLVLVPLPAAWDQLPARLRDAVPGAFGFASFAMVVVLAARLASRLRLAAVPFVALTLIAFVFALPGEAIAACVRFVLTRGAGGLGSFAHTLGASGLFTAIVVTLASAWLCVLARRRYADPAATIAGAGAALAVSVALWLLGLSLAGGLATVLAPLATLGDSLGALVIITAIEALLFVVGIHGPALLAAIILPVYLALQFQNTAALHAHQPLPHLVVVSTFLFVFPGGAGATLPLVLILLRSRVPRLKKFAYATLVPSLLNVNEPVIFGLPLAFNPTLAVPFILAPVALAIVSWSALALGLVRAPVYYVPSTIPVFVSVFLATFDWRACVLIVVNLVLAGAIWLPFVRVFERAEAKRA